MEFFDVIKKRHSVRAFKNKPIKKEKIKKILETINSAPSAGNLQAYKVILIRDQKLKDKLTTTSLLGQDFISGAPVILVFFADPEQSGSRYQERGEELYCIQDATIACSYAQLVATELGLASCWIGAFNENRVKELLGVKANLKPVVILPIGYPAEKPIPRPRKLLSDLMEER